MLVYWFILPHPFWVCLSCPLSTGTENKIRIFQAEVCLRYAVEINQYQNSSSAQGVFDEERGRIKIWTEIWQIISVKTLGPGFWAVHSWAPVEIESTASLQRSHKPGTWGAFNPVHCGLFHEFTCRKKHLPCISEWDLWVPELILCHSELQHGPSVLVTFSIQSCLQGPHACWCVFGRVVALLRDQALQYQLELLVLWFRVCNPLR